MSTALLGQNRFADIRRSLIEHGTEDMQDKSCGTKASNIARSLGVTAPFGESGKSQVRLIASSFAFDLARLNHAAFVDRYEDEKDTPAPHPLNGTRGKKLNPCALLKGLQCVRYNCDGGKVANESLLASLAMLNEVIEALRGFIIDELPEYKNADWF